MDIHQNARLTPHGRAELVRRGLLEGQAAKAVAPVLNVMDETGPTPGTVIRRRHTGSWRAVRNSRR